MSNLRIKDQYTNLQLNATTGAIKTTTDAPTTTLRVGDSISQIGVKNGLLCINTGGTKFIDAGVRDLFKVAITSTGAVISLADFVDAIKPYNNTSS